MLTVPLLSRVLCSEATATTHRGNNHGPRDAHQEVSVETVKVALASDGHGVFAGGATAGSVWQSFHAARLCACMCSFVNVRQRLSMRGAYHPVQGLVPLHHAKLLLGIMTKNAGLHSVVLRRCVDNGCMLYILPGSIMMSHTAAAPVPALFPLLQTHHRPQV